jgi:ribose 5-phosphate isomerase B
LAVGLPLTKSIDLNMERIDIGCDHAGYVLKEQMISVLKDLGYEIEDHGTNGETSVDYPDYAHPVADAVEQKNGRGILICGSANGVAMAANKHLGIRAAICWTPEIAALARQHNDANVLCLPARFISEQEAKEIMLSFLNTSFEGGRHANRVSKISCN